MKGQELNGVLFASESILNVIELRKRQAMKAVKSLSANQVMESSDDRLLEYFTGEFDLDPLKLFLDRSEKRVAETTVETRDGFT